MVGPAVQATARATSKAAELQSNLAAFLRGICKNWPNPPAAVFLSSMKRRFAPLLTSTLNVTSAYQRRFLRPPPEILTTSVEMRTSWV